MDHAGTSPQAVTRLDGRVKVTGAALYGADMAAANEAFAFLVTSPIAKGAIMAIDDRPARAVRGVLDVLTYRDVGDAIRPGKLFSQGGFLGSTIQPMASDKDFRMRARSSRSSLPTVSRRRARAPMRSTCVSPLKARPRPSTARERKPSPPRTRLRSTRTRRSATPNRPLPQPRSRSTRFTRRRRSITIPSNCSPRCAPGMAPT